MRVFLGLGDAQLLQPGSRYNLTEGILEILRREQRAEEAVEFGRILDKPECRGKDDTLSTCEAREIRVEQGCGDLAHPIGAKIRDQHPVTVLCPRVAGNRGRLDELIGFTPSVGRCYTLPRVLGA